MISAIKYDFTADNEAILRLKVTIILRIWLKEFSESHPRILSVVFCQGRSSINDFKHVAIPNDPSTEL
jgi:hypothetical protein